MQIGEGVERPVGEQRRRDEERHPYRERRDADGGEVTARRYMRIRGSQHARLWAATFGGGGVRAESLARGRGGLHHAPYCMTGAPKRKVLTRCSDGTAEWQDVLSS